MNALLRPPTNVRDEFLVPELPEPSVKPQLLWPSIKYGKRIENQDTNFFPIQQNVRERHKAPENGTILQLVEFKEAVMKAEVCILVLDPHFDIVGFHALEDAISNSQASDVRLLTGRGDIEGKERERKRKELTQYCNLYRNSPHMEVLWKATLDKHIFPFLHDRFAIVDGGLWHFGSNVGGGHPGLTAASGPWSATRTKAMKFFDEWWRSCHA